MDTEKKKTADLWAALLVNFTAMHISSLRVAFKNKVKKLSFMSALQTYDRILDLITAMVSLHTFCNTTVVHRNVRSTN